MKGKKIQVKFYCWKKKRNSERFDLIFNLFRIPCYHPHEFNSRRRRLRKNCEKLKNNRRTAQQQHWKLWNNSRNNCFVCRRVNTCERLDFLLLRSSQSECEYFIFFHSIYRQAVFSRGGWWLRWWCCCSNSLYLVLAVNVRMCSDDEIKFHVINYDVPLWFRSFESCLQLIRRHNIRVHLFSLFLSFRQCCCRLLLDFSSQYEIEPLFRLKCVTIRDTRISDSYEFFSRNF